MKIRLLLTTSFFSLLSFFNSYSYSQSNDWKLLTSENGINIYTQKAFCDLEGAPNQFEYLLFKAENTSTSELEFDIQFEIHFEEGCNGCQGTEETGTRITLKAGDSIEGSCSNLENKLSYFILNPSFKDSWKYTHAKALIQPIK